MAVKTGSLLMIILVFTLASCTVHPLKYQGDNAEVNLLDGRKITGELLMQYDSTLWILSGSKAGWPPDSAKYLCEKIDFRKINTIVIDGYVNHYWWGLAGSNLLGGILMLAAASSVGLTGGAIFLVSPLLQLLLFVASEPDNPTITFPLDDVKSRELLKYVRLPQDLDSSQFGTFLHQLGNPIVRSVE